MSHRPFFYLYPSFGEVRAEVFFLVEGRGGRDGNLHLVVFQTSTLHVRVLYGKVLQKRGVSREGVVTCYV